jgi:signal transduction histidine kinase
MNQPTVMIPSNSRLVSLFRRYSRGAGATGILVCASVLVGSLYNIPLLKSVIAGLFAMKVNPALCFILAGVALGLLENEAEFAHAFANMAGALAERATQIEANNKELDAFDYSVSHYLRARLRHMRGFGEILKKNAGELLDVRSQRCLNTILGSMEEMATMIDGLLAFSRIERVNRKRILKAPASAWPTSGASSAGTAVTPRPRVPSTKGRRSIFRCRPRRGR